MKNSLSLLITTFIIGLTTTKAQTEVKYSTTAALHGQIKMLNYPNGIPECPGYFVEFLVGPFYVSEQQYQETLNSGATFICRDSILYFDGVHGCGVKRQLVLHSHHRILLNGNRYRRPLSNAKQFQVTGIVIQRKWFRKRIMVTASKMP